MSWEKQGQLPPCCDLPEELSIIDWQPYHKTQAKDGMTLDQIKEKRSVQHQEGLKPKQMWEELEHRVPCCLTILQTLSSFIFITTPRGRVWPPSLSGCKSTLCVLHFRDSLR